MKQNFEIETLMEEFWFSWFSMNVSSTLDEDDNVDEDRKIISTTASCGRGQKTN